MRRLAATAMLATAALSAACSFDFAFLDEGVDAARADAGPGSPDATSPDPDADALPPVDANGPRADAGVDATVDANGDATVDGNGDAGVPPLKPGTIALGALHGCAVRDNGTAKCWGVSTHGQLGSGESFSVGQNVPNPPRVVVESEAEDASAVTRIAAIGAGEDHTCAIIGGGMFCWGGDQFNQRGYEGPDVNVPTRVQAATPLTFDVMKLTVGMFHSCAMRRDGHVWCWGLNSDRQASPDTEQDVLATARDNSFTNGSKDLAAGSDHTCAVSSTNAVSCWGKNDYQQCGTATSVACSSGPCVKQPATVSAAQGAIHVAAGYAHTCALIKNGEVACWGYNGSGQTGKTPPPACSSGAAADCGAAPAIIPSLGSVVKLALGGSHTCAIKADRTVWCWGENAGGELGLGTNDTAPHPVATAAVVRATGGVLSNVVDLAAHAGTTCARTADEKLYCWGQRIPRNPTNKATELLW